MVFKVVTAKCMAKAEQEAYKEGYSEAGFMNQAGQGIAEFVADYIEKHHLSKKVLLLCGKGNNAGDAYVAGTALVARGYDVKAIEVVPLEECSPLCQMNLKAFQAARGVVQSVTDDNVEEYLEAGVIVDGLFGTGFKGLVKEPFASLIRKANASKKPILAVDIPSGVNGDTGVVEGDAIVATETLFLGLPKTGFFLENGWNYVGALRYVNFGLPLSSQELVKEDFRLLTIEDIARLIPRHKRNAHKYERGYVVGLAGSKNMPGAAMLSSLAALRSGSGIVRLLHPKGMEAELSPSPYEIIREGCSFDKVDPILKTLEKASSVFIGPGLGQSLEVTHLLNDLLPKITKPCVIDADALNLIASGKVPLLKKSILTPHKGEMDRLLSLTSFHPLNREYLQQCKQFAERHDVTIVLKGGPTFIIPPIEMTVCPNSDFSGNLGFVCPVGDPGMATAGSGDVLTGVIASMLAQGLSCIEAAKFGVFLHGLAGESAAVQKTSHSMIASDLIQYFPEAYRKIERSCEGNEC